MQAWNGNRCCAPLRKAVYITFLRREPGPARAGYKYRLYWGRNSYLHPVRAGPRRESKALFISKFYSTAVGRGHCRQGRLSVCVGMRLGRPARWATPPVVLPRLPTPVRGRGSPRGFEHNRSRDKRQRSFGCAAPSTDDLHRLCIDRLFCLHVQGVTIHFLAVQASEPSFSAYLELNAPSTPPTVCAVSLFLCSF
jgi:hypothetical protein